MVKHILLSYGIISVQLILFLSLLNLPYIKLLTYEAPQGTHLENVSFPCIPYTMQYSSSNFV
jgi:hypothetical protein